MAYLLHPQQLVRAAATEHIGVMLAFPLIPLTWLCFARALEQGRLRRIGWCALAMVALAATSYKQALVQSVFLLAYLWIGATWRGGRWRETLRTCALTGAWAMALAAVILVPLWVETPLVKGLSDQETARWQRMYSLKSVLALVDREGVLTRTALEGLQEHLRSHPVPSPEERAQVGAVFALELDASEKYAGIALLGMVAGAALCNRRRVDRRLFWLLLGMLGAAVALGTGPASVLEANARSLRALLSTEGVPRSIQLALLAAGLAGLCLVGISARRKRASRRATLIALAAVAAFLCLPVFSWLSLLPPFGQIRAPYSFYDLPGAFFASLLAGFFVTDVACAPPTGKAGISRRGWLRPGSIVAAATLLMALDYWPYQQHMKVERVPAQTLANLRASYTWIGRDAAPVKTYALSRRYFHLLGPMLSGKPQAWEAWTHWMAPIGTGLLHEHARKSIPAHRAFLDLLGVRYPVYDKTDPKAGPREGRLEAIWRASLPVVSENEDFAVFRNDQAWPLLRAFDRPCLYVGDLPESAPLSLALASLRYPLVHAPYVDGVADLSGARLESFEAIYVADPEAGVERRAVSQGAWSRVVDVTDDAPIPLPATPGSDVPLTIERIERVGAQLLRLSIELPRAGLVVINESYYPHWRALLDGRDARILRVSTGLMGLRVPEGRHELVVTYRPPRIYRLAVLVSGLGLVASGVALLWPRSSRSR
jgi:hypothetical protein